MKEPTDQYQLTQIQFLGHIFRKWHQLPQMFTDTYGGDCLTNFAYTISDEVFKSYEEFAGEFFELMPDDDFEFAQPEENKTEDNTV